MAEVATPKASGLSGKWAGIPKSVWIIGGVVVVVGGVYLYERSKANAASSSTTSLMPTPDVASTQTSSTTTRNKRRPIYIINNIPASGNTGTGTGTGGSGGGTGGTGGTGGSGGGTGGTGGTGGSGGGTGGTGGTGGSGGGSGGSGGGGGTTTPTSLTALQEAGNLGYGVQSGSGWGYPNLDWLTNPDGENPQNLLNAGVPLYYLNNNGTGNVPVPWKGYGSQVASGALKNGAGDLMLFINPNASTTATSSGDGTTVPIAQATTTSSSTTTPSVYSDSAAQQAATSSGYTLGQSVDGQVSAVSNVPNPSTLSPAPSGYTWQNMGIESGNEYPTYQLVKS